MPENDSIVEYRDIPGFPGYRVGNDGSVWRRWVNCRWGRRLADKWRPMKLSLSKRGYPQVNLTPPEGGSYRTFRVHRLMLEAFVMPCPKGMEGRHLNGIKTDNCLANLAWGTQEENRNDNHANGSYQNGERHSQAKLTDANVVEMRHLRKLGTPLRQLAEKYGVSQPSVSEIVNRKLWKHLD